MVEVASQIVVCLIVAAFIGFLIGYIVGRVFGSDKVSTYGVTSHNGMAVGNIYNKPLIRSFPRPVGKDKLEQIEGIDKNLEHKLNQLGIFHFDQIAKWNDKNCLWVEEYFSLEEGQIKAQKWVEQAKQFSNII